MTSREKELITLAKSGDLDAFTALVELYQERAIRVAYSIVGNFEDARDLAQEAFMKAHEKLGSFKEESRFYTWLYRIVSNLCKDFLRKKNLRKFISFWDRPGEDDHDENPEERVAGSVRAASQELLNTELGEKIFEALDKLPFRQRSAFALRYLEGLELAEIAESMDLSVGTVKAHLWHAVQKTRKILKEYLSPEEG